MKRISSFGFGALLSVVSLGVLTACGSSGGGTGGTGGSGGTATTSSSSSSSSSTSSSSSSSGTGGGCHGDATAWATLTQGPVTCTKNSDCCVIINACTNEAQIVSATNEAQAKAAWPYCGNDCTDCIPPAIEVACDNGVCAGKSVDFADASPNLMNDHCGVDGTTGVTAGKLHFTCGGG